MSLVTCVTLVRGAPGTTCCTCCRTLPSTPLPCVRNSTSSGRGTWSPPFRTNSGVRRSPLSFMVIGDDVPIRGSSAPMPYSYLPLANTIKNKVEPELSLPWTIKQETHSQSEVTSVDTSKNMSFANNIDSRRKVSIKRGHTCWWCKAGFRYYPNLRNHEQVCSNKPIEENITLSCSHCSKICHSGADLKKHYKQKPTMCKRYMQMVTRSRKNIKRKQYFDVYFSHALRSSKRKCNIKS